jgi:hypothetical protein
MKAGHAVLKNRKNQRLSQAEASHWPRHQRPSAMNSVATKTTNVWTCGLSGQKQLENMRQRPNFTGFSR